MEAGQPAQEAAEDHLRDLNRRFGNPLMFVICIDRDANIGTARNVHLTPHACWRGDWDAPKGNFAPVFE